MRAWFSEAQEQGGATHPASGPDPADDPPARGTDGIVGLICTCIVEGLMHCACAHQHANPDLAACIQDLQNRRRKGAE